MSKEIKQTGSGYLRWFLLCAQLLLICHLAVASSDKDYESVPHTKSRDVPLDYDQYETNYDTTPRVHIENKKHMKESAETGHETNHESSSRVAGKKYMEENDESEANDEASSGSSGDESMHMEPLQGSGHTDYDTEPNEESEFNSHRNGGTDLGNDYDARTYQEFKETPSFGSGDLTGSSACPAGRFGAACAFRCHCADHAHCDSVTGCHGPCAPGWSGHGCQTGDNVGLHKAAYQSGNLYAWSATAPELAVDGRSEASSCSATDRSDSPWWKVDLGMCYVIQQISITLPEGSVFVKYDNTSDADWSGKAYNDKHYHGDIPAEECMQMCDKDTHERCKAVSICPGIHDEQGCWRIPTSGEPGNFRRDPYCSVAARISPVKDNLRIMVDGSNHTQSGDHCGSETTTTTTGQDITVKCQPPGLGRFLTIATKQPKSVLSLCDVKISGYEFVACGAGFYGQLCDKRCPAECANGFCNKDTGICCFRDEKGPYCEGVIEFCLHHGCSSSPCQNNAACRDVGASYVCDCPAEYSGSNCEQHTAVCSAASPCANNGECVQIGHSHHCKCAEGFSGQRCEVGHPVTVANTACSSSPCLNNGICSDQENGTFSCQCPRNYTGQLCENTMASCQDYPCFNDGTCRQDKGTYRCSCPPGFHGHFCESYSPVICGNFTCQNNGLCVLSNTGLTCFCLPGYGGVECEKVFGTNCSDELCGQNGGTCDVQHGRRVCHCPPGILGDNCEFEINECHSNPCSANATCIDRLDGFRCTCPTGTTGESCDSSISLKEGHTMCDLDPCLKGRECLATELGYECICPAGYRGIICEDEIPCHRKPCHNGGECIEAPNQCTNNNTNCSEENFSCQCAEGFSGALCENKMVLCDNSTCMNDGDCVLSGDMRSFKCVCHPGYTGTKCEWDIGQLCDSAPCQNGAECQNVVEDFYCSCPEGYTGRYCEVDIDECRSFPCENGGKCVDKVNTYKCICSKDYIGENCEKLSNQDFCARHSCQNGGTCQNTESEAVCVCSPLWSGRMCEQRIHPCDDHNCGMGSFCNEDVNNVKSGYKCIGIPKPHSAPRGGLSRGTLAAIAVASIAVFISVLIGLFILIDRNYRKHLTKYERVGSDDPDDCGNQRSSGEGGGDSYATVGEISAELKEIRNMLASKSKSSQQPATPAAEKQTDDSGKVSDTAPPAKQSASDSSQKNNVQRLALRRSLVLSSDSDSDQ